MHELEPFDPEAEHSILGMALKYPTQAVHFRNLGLKPEHFRNPDLGEVWKRVENTDNGHPLFPEDLADLADALRNAVPGEMLLEGAVSKLIRKNRNNHLRASVESLYNKLSRGDADDASLKAHADLIAAEALRVSGDKASHSEVAFDIRALLALDVEQALLDHSVLGKGWLPEKSGFTFTGPTGHGKSVWNLQACMHWAIGRPYFGIGPKQPIKILYIQAEDGEVDLAEMTQGCFDEDLSEEQIDLLAANLRIVKLNGCRNEALTRYVSECLPDFQAHIVVLNPVFSFMKGDLKDAEATGHFLRDLLDPFMEQNNLCIGLVAHVPKPQQIKGENVGHQTEYAAYGSVEFANWPRATLELVLTAARGIYRLRAGKRRNRTSWSDETGEIVHEKTISWSDDRLAWKETSEKEAAPSAGRKESFPAEWVFDCIRTHPHTAAEIQRFVNEEHHTDFSYNSVSAKLRRLKNDGAVNQDERRRWELTE